jgi:hypothetical protein
MAETFSALYITDKDHIVLVENEEPGKEVKKEKEENINDKISGNRLAILCRNHNHQAVVLLFSKETTGAIHSGYSSLPELPPKQA